MKQVKNRLIYQLNLRLLLIKQVKGATVNKQTYLWEKKMLLWIVEKKGLIGFDKQKHNSIDRKMKQEITKCFGIP